MLGRQLYVLHGTLLTALDPLNNEILWSSGRLLDDTATPAQPRGAGPPLLVGERSWWYPHTAPEPLGAGKLILPLRSREIVEIDTRNNHLISKLITSLPLEPVGRVYLERDTLLGGKSLLAVGCADGRIGPLASPSLPRRFGRGRLTPRIPSPRAPWRRGLPPCRAARSWR